MVLKGDKSMSKEERNIRKAVEREEVKETDQRKYSDTPLYFQQT